MARKYFGTDGVRGQVGEAPMTVDFALRLASAAARVLAPKGGSGADRQGHARLRLHVRVRAGGGFRRGGRRRQAARAAADAGHRLSDTRFGADLGVVISASHNLYDDNGIKFFDRNGSKLSDEIEAKIEALLERPADHARSERSRPRRARRQCASTATRVSAPDVADGHEARRPAHRHRLRQRRDLQGRAARVSPTSVPTSSRSAARRTAATSTTAAAPPRPALLQRTVTGRRRRPRHRARR